MNPNVKQVVFVQGQGLGNMVMALPALEKLVNTGYEVNVVGKYPALDLLSERFNAYTLDDIETLPEVDILLLSCWSSEYIAKYGRNPHVGTAEVYESDPVDGTRHEAHLHLDLASCVDGVDFNPNTDTIEPPYIPTTHVDMYTDEKPYVVLCNTAAVGWGKKRWGGYAELAHILSKEFDIVVLGSQVDKDFYNPKDFPVDTEALFYLPIRESASVLQQAEWVIGNDCGLTHIASALGVQTIALFGATSRVKNAPLGLFVNESALQPTTITVFPKMSCSPCQFQQWESICEVNECMQWIEPEKVANYILGKNHNVSNLYRIERTQSEQKLAVVMRVKNAIDTIEECLTEANRIADIFCIVDNGSTDGTLEYILDFKEQHPEKFGYHEDLIISGMDIIHAGIFQTVGHNQPRDRQIMNMLLKDSGATWGVFLDSDEIVSKQINREMIVEWMSQNEYNAIKFPSCSLLE